MCISVVTLCGKSLIIDINIKLFLQKVKRQTSVIFYDSFILKTILQSFGVHEHGYYYDVVVGLILYCLFDVLNFVLGLVFLWSVVVTARIE